MKRKLPKLANDAAAEAFIDKVDLTEYDLSEMRALRSGLALSVLADSILPREGEV